MIDRYHLRYFLSVIDSGNFSRAAATCNVSQPTLSVGIAKLEQSLGQTLFTRTNRRVALTDAGSRLVSFARGIEAEFTAAEREVSGTTSVQLLRLGVLATTPRQWIEAFLRRYRSEANQNPIEIIEGRVPELRERLVRGRIDAALTTIREGDVQFVSHKVFTEGYSLALGASHPFSGRDFIEAEELVNDPMIVRRHCELLPETSRFFTSRGVRPVFSSRTTSDEKALSYVRAGLGVTVMPDGFREPGIVRAHIKGFEFTRDIGLIFAPHADVEALRHGPFVSALVESLEARDGA